MAANVAEGYRKRQYPSMFVSKLADADAETTETQVWLNFARDCGYLPLEQHDQLTSRCDEVGKILGGMIRSPEKYVTIRSTTRGD